MHQIVGDWGFAPDPSGGAYSVDITSHSYNLTLGALADIFCLYLVTLNDFIFHVFIFYHVLFYCMLCMLCVSHSVTIVLFAPVCFLVLP